MRAALIWVLILGGSPAAAGAQELKPVLDLPELARGQVIGATAKSFNKPKGAPRGAVNQQRRAGACAKIPRFRVQHGAMNPKVRQLETLCPEAGFPVSP